MFSRIKNFICRHRRKFLVSGVVIGGSILLTRYAQKKFIEWQDKETKDFLERTRKQYQFESTERTCNQTIISLSIQLKNEISKIFDSESLLTKIRSVNKDEKIRVWEDLKVISFAKHTALLYCGLMLSVVIRVQLNIMAGITARDLNRKTDLAVQESYLSLCQHFIHSGCRDVCKLIDKHVREICGKISLKSKMSLNDLEHLFWSIQASISDDEYDPLRNLPKYLFSESCSSSSMSEEVRNLFHNTVKILEKDEVSTMADTCTGRAFTNSIDSLAEYFISSNENVNTLGESSKASVNGSLVNSGPLTHPINVQIPVAKIIPIIHGLSKVRSKNGDADSWICQFLIMDKISTLGEDVFSSFANAPK